MVEHGEEHAIQTGDLAYRPLLTSRFVLAGLATLLMRKGNHTTASGAVSNIRSSAAFTIYELDESAVAAACEQFEQYDDQQISLVNHTSAVLAREHDTTDVFAFDSDFVTLGRTRVPVDTGEP